MTQMVEIAQTGYDLCIGKMSAFNNKKTISRVEDREKTKDSKSFNRGKFKGKKKFSRSKPYLSVRETNDLYEQKKCYFCKKPGHISIDCPKKKSTVKEKEK